MASFSVVSVFFFAKLSSGSDIWLITYFNVVSVIFCQAQSRLWDNQTLIYGMQLIIMMCHSFFAKLSPRSVVGTFVVTRFPHLFLS